LNGGFIHIAMFLLSLEDVVVYKTQFNISTYYKQCTTIQVNLVDIIDLLLVRPQPAANISLWAGFLFFCDNARLSLNRKENCQT
jgi:hypothetical protein